MSVAVLLYNYTFGIKSDVQDNIHYIDDTTIVFPSGHNTVILNLESKAQRFIPGTERTEGIASLAVSPNKKFIAVAEEAEKAMVTVFDLLSPKMRRKVLSTPECLAKKFVCMAFSADNKFLLTQGGEPDWTLVLWQWEKNKCLSAVKPPTLSPISLCSFNPDGNLACMTGKGACRFFRISEMSLKMLPSGMAKRDTQDYTSHCWLSEERMIVGTDTGDLILVEAGEYRATLASSPSDGQSIDCIVRFSKGFICGGDGGVIHVFERSDEKETTQMYRRAKTFKIDGNPYKVTSIIVSQNDDVLICSLANNQVFTLSLSSIDIVKQEEISFDHVAQPYHSLQVSGLDVCVRKPLVATCGLDKSVRIWNYLDHSSELVKFFNDEAHSVVMHPSGLQVLVGFSDKLRLMNILMDDVRPFKEFPIKQCLECAFSNGGHMFAAVNGNTIQIFNTYTCENVGNLRGHNGKVRSLFWTNDDSKLISAGNDGAVYEWSLRDFKRSGESVLKGCTYSCATATPDGKATYAVGSDQKLKEIIDSTITNQFDAGVKLTQVVVSNSGKMLMAGTSTGTIRSYKFPLTGEFVEYQAHSAAVTRMKVAFDDSVLFSCGEDGTMFIFDLRDKEGRSKTISRDIPFAEEILVTKSDLEEKTQLMNELKQKVEELTMQNEYQMRLKDLNHSEKIKDLKEKFSAELDDMAHRNETLVQEKQDLEIEAEERLRAAEEKAQHQIQMIESQYQQKIMTEVERYQQLFQEKELLNERWEERNAMLVEGHEKMIQEVTEDFETKLHEDQLMMEQLRQDKSDQGREFEETRRQLEEDADKEIEELKERYEQKLGNERDIGLRLKGENGIMRKRFVALQQDIQQQKEEIKQQFEDKQQLYNQITSLEKDIAGLKKEIRERDETIGDKEKRIYDLKKKNQELEKFKFVLDYKIKELKKQIEPREMEIADMKEQIKEMDQELERYHKQNGALELKIQDLKLRLDGLQNENGLQRQKNADANSVIKRFRNDLHDVIQHIQDPKNLKDAIKKLYQKHVIDQVQSIELDVDIQKEYNRQREYLEKSVESLKRKLNKDSELHRTDNMRIMQENAALIKEINELRREMRQMKQGTKDKKSIRTQKDLQKEIDMQKAEIRRLRERLEELEDGRMLARPISRERLPPMDGYNDPDAKSDDEGN